jgi:hypothetical protein
VVPSREKKAVRQARLQMALPEFLGQRFQWAVKGTPFQAPEPNLIGIPFHGIGESIKLCEGKVTKWH